jgi:pimeloyl-ACP methyl ester carboxylesterase
MPTIHVNGVRLYYEETGTGDEVMLFSHGLLMNLHMFDDQIAHFSQRYRCIAYDHRGQGRSEVTADGYDMETVYEDAVALMDALGLDAVHFVGLSMGGFVGMRLAARRPDRVKSLVLMETSADEEPKENLPRYNLLRFVARWISPTLIVNGAATSLFGQSFRTDPAKAATRKRWRQHIGSVSGVGAAKAAQGVFSRQSVYDEISKITAPTLVIVGDEDTATVPEKAERIHYQIDQSTLVRVAGAGHSSSIEQPQAIIDAMQDFYDRLEGQG